MREALLMLQAEGLIDTTPNRGAVVRAHDADDLLDLYQLRALLEGYAARQAAARVSDETIGLLLRELRPLRQRSPATTSASSSPRISCSTARSTPRPEAHG